MSNDPRDLIARSPMSPRQVLVVAITIALNALDGFDVLSISFASPGIAAEWKITENNRRARFYSLTAAGRSYLRKETESWLRYSRSVTAIMTLKSRSASV